jgi:hypothetical protein
MKSMIATASVVTGLLLTTSFSAIAADSTAMTDAAPGVYQGRLTCVTCNKGAPKDYDFEVDIMSIDASSGKIVIKVTSDFYRNKEIVRKNCLLDAAKPGLVFNCKGDTWHEDYEVKGDSVKADAVTSGYGNKNFVYYMSAIKVKK